MNPGDLPPLWNGNLDRAGVEQLLHDLATHTEVLSVLEKAAPGVRCSPNQPTLAEAAEHLLSGSVRGIQVRYHHNGQRWCDTILRLAEGYRVVRAREAGS